MKLQCPTIDKSHSNTLPHRQSSNSINRSNDYAIREGILDMICIDRDMIGSGHATPLPPIHNSKHSHLGV